MRSVFPCLLVAALAALSGSAVYAQSYPAKPVRFIIPFPPDGPTDLVGRTAADRLTKMGPDEFSVFLKREMEKWAKDAKFANVRVD